MRRIILAFSALVATVALSSEALAINCVAYVKDATNFQLRGDAWLWWEAAYGTYGRGHHPEIGAVMVFSRTKQMRHGHVAVVRSVVGRREILIDHANWSAGRGKGLIDRGVSVIDVSAANDWSSVRVQWARTASYGRLNPISGFIYANTGRKPRPSFMAMNR